MLKSCLLIIDAQEAWRDRKSRYYIGDLKKFVEANNRLIDWAHQKKIPVIFSLHKFKKDRSDILPQEKKEMDDFIDGNQRAELIVDIKRGQQDLVLTKNRFSFFSNPKLAKILKERGIGELIITGLTTNCCVRATIIDAYNLAYKITVVKEACASGSQKTDEFTFCDIDSLLFNLNIINLEQFLKNYGNKD